MKVCVVTPFFDEPPDVLRRCVDSVAAQTHACTHLLISDGATEPAPEGVRVIELGRSHSDYGNTPRGIGALLAVAEGFDAIAFLDADNWYDPDHIARCIAAALPGPEIDAVLARRRFRTPEGQVLDIPDEPVDTHCDTSCFFVLRGAFHLLATWALIPRELADRGDRIFLRRLRNPNLATRQLAAPTVNYTTHWPAHYQAAGRETPPNARNIDFAKGPALVRAMTARGRQVVWRRTGGLTFDPPLRGFESSEAGAIHVHDLPVTPRTAPEAFLACARRCFGSSGSDAELIRHMRQLPFPDDAALRSLALQRIEAAGGAARFRAATLMPFAPDTLAGSDGTPASDTVAGLSLALAISLCAAIRTDDPVIACLAEWLKVPVFHPGSLKTNN